MTTIEEEPFMLDLIQAIVTGDVAQVSELLEVHPHLAQTRIIAGATRQQAQTHFFEEIAHYLYRGDTALHAAAAGYNREAARMLLDKGADIGAKNRRGAEALHYASDSGLMTRTWNSEPQEVTITFLITAGANPNAVDMDCVTPLHRAVRTRSAGAVRALLAHGADVRLKNKNGSTPLHLAVQNTGRGGSGQEEAKLQQSQIIKLLLQSGANAEDEDNNGKAVRDWIREESIRSLIL